MHDAPRTICARRILLLALVVIEIRADTLLHQTEAKNDEKELAAAIKQAAADEKTLRKARKAEAQSIKVCLRA